jgi:uncharacterized protein
MKGKTLIKEEEKVVSNAVSFVKKRLHNNDFSGHDWWHIYRVWKMAIYLADQEKANSFEVQLASLLHDIDDWKLKKKPGEPDKNMAKNWLHKQGLHEKIIRNVQNIIQELSFKGAGVPTLMSSLEGKVVQDADRLDAIGAIGIARAFTFGGNHKREMHNPEINPVMHQSFEAYKKDQSTTINHFYEKLLLLKDRMNTATAKKLASKRHIILEKFLQQFMAEWEGIK